MHDPALGPVVAWQLFGDSARAVLRGRLACSELSWRRGMAWAFRQAMALVRHYETTNPPMSALGRRTLGRVLDAS